MATEDLSSLSYGQAGFATVVVAMEASAWDAREIVLPEWCRSFTIQFATTNVASTAVSAAGAYSHTGTDGAVLPDGTWAPVAVGGSVSDVIVAAGRSRQEGGSIIYAAAAVATGFCVLTLHRGS